MMNTLKFLLAVCLLFVGGGLPGANALTGSDQVVGEWYESDWYGWYSVLGYDWILHLEHGYQYVQGSSLENLYIYDYNMECWLWTASGRYPFLYKFGQNAGWYWYYTGAAPGERWFNRSADQQAVREEDINKVASSVEGYVQVSAGTFTMGTPESEWGHSNADELQHEVTLTRGFLVKESEVTNAEMVDVLNWALSQGRVSCSAGAVISLDGNPKELLDLDSQQVEISWDGAQLVVDTGKEDYPCREVSWYGAGAYCNYLSTREGLQEAINFETWNMDLSASGYRLPTVAEAEYYSRAGTQTAYYTGEILATGNTLDENLDRAAWYKVNSGLDTHPVAGKVANAWGLYDTLGNVIEWCYDFSPDYPTADPVTDPVGPASGANRAAHGGGYYSDGLSCRSGDRWGNNATNSRADVGFRPVRTHAL